MKRSLIAVPVVLLLCFLGTGQPAAWAGGGSGGGGGALGVAFSRPSTAVSKYGTQCTYSLTTDVVVTNHGSQADSVDSVNVAASWTDGHATGPSTPHIVQTGGLKAGASLPKGARTFSGLVVQLSVPCKAVSVSLQLTVKSAKHAQGTASVDLVDSGVPLPALPLGATAGLVGVSAGALLLVGRRRRRGADS